MLKLEGFLAMGTLKLTKHGTLIMADHVPLESVDVSKGLAAHLAGLEKFTMVNFVWVSRVTSFTEQIFS